LNCGIDDPQFSLVATKADESTAQSSTFLSLSNFSKVQKGSV